MTSTKATNISWHYGALTKRDREKLLGQRGVVVWFTGLPSSGKSTLAHSVERELHSRGHLSYVLDGDNIRHGLNKNLGFSPTDREENIRRIGEVAKLFAEAGVITLTAFISPYRRDREKARSLMERGEFIEVFVHVPLKEAEKRDPKGLYKKAKAGKIKEFTGISAPYEEPIDPEIMIDTTMLDVEMSKQKILAYLEQKGIIKKSAAEKICDKRHRSLFSNER